MIQYILFALATGLLFHGIHRKLIARIQGRPGPPVWQEILHTLKFSFKQTWIPDTASEVHFVGVVLISIAIWILALGVVIYEGSVLLLFAIYLLHKIVEHGMGLSSGSPYAKFGAIRSVISAASELPLFVTILLIYYFTGSLMLSDIIQWQASNGPLIIPAFPAAVAMYLIILSKMHFGPFSIIEGKEIVSGNRTEHFGVWRAGLEAGFAIKTYVLLNAFVLIFLGSFSLPVLVLIMAVILMTLSFVCAYCPLLGPYDTVTVQSLVTGVLLAYIIILEVVL
ncbi:MAG: NADH-quinone oxidoreductase subunit H [Methanospirillaceae archaeon]|nr:NADH-quinone oxidoreductase subunit H [Methanospirillaceae archaeon]